MGWSEMRLKMKLNSTKSDLQEELKKKPGLQNKVRLSNLRRQIADIEKQIDNVKDD